VFPVLFASDELLLVIVCPRRECLRSGIAAVSLTEHGPPGTSVMAPVPDEQLTRSTGWGVSGHGILVYRKDWSRADDQGWELLAGSLPPDEAEPPVALARRRLQGEDDAPPRFAGFVGPDRVLYALSGRPWLAWLEGLRARVPVALATFDGLVAPALGPVGPNRRIVAGTGTSELGLHLLPDDGGVSTRLTPEDGSAERPVAWSAEGGWIVHEGLEGPWLAVKASPAEPRGAPSPPRTLLAVPGADVRLVTVVGPDATPQ